MSVTATMHGKTKGNPRGSGYVRAERDLYVEPAWAIEALLDVEKIGGLVWDPACGTGTIPRVCRRRGLDVGGTDLANGIDFLSVTEKNWPLEPTAYWTRNRLSIVCNPPYRLAERFVLHAIALRVPLAAFFLRLAFLEGAGRRQRIFDPHPPARVWTFSRRVSCPSPGALIGGRKAGGGAMAFAWFVWTRDWKGPGYKGGWLP